MQESIANSLEAPMVDMETGEIIEGNMDTSLDGMPQLGRAIRAIERRKAMLKKYLADEIARLQSVVDAKIRPLDESHAELMRYAAFNLGQAGQKKIQYPGIGTFRFRNMPAKVDASEYEAMTDEAKAALHAAAPQWFNIVTRVKPKKTEIAKALNTGTVLDGIVVPGCFSLTTDDPKFEFQGEN